MYQERELCFWDNKQPKNNFMTRVMGDQRSLGCPPKNNFMTRVMGDQRRSATNPESWQLS
jgi:hypothetical protein